MKYCLSVGLHNLFFDIAIVDNKHEIVKKVKCNYDRTKDIARNIHLAYQKHFSNYNVSYLGVGISNNIGFKDDILYKIKSFDLNGYNLKQSLYKLFEKEIYIYDETYLAALSVSYKVEGSLLYILMDTRISNSFVIEHSLVELEDDIDLSKNEELYLYCRKDAIKARFLENNLDDDYIGTYFFSQSSNCKSIIKDWAQLLNKNVMKTLKNLPVKNIAFAGYLGEFFNSYKDYMSIDKTLNCMCINNHRREVLIGISHLIFKDS